MKRTTFAAPAALTVALLASSLPTPSHAQSATDFDLVCYGVGDRLESHRDYEWDHKHHEYREQTTLATAQKEGSVQVEIHEGQGRLRVPKSLLPPLSSDRDGGWFPIRDLMIGDERITGSIKINGLNKPGLSIDRRSGQLKLQGLQSFEGNCTAFNPGSTRF